MPYAGLVRKAALFGERRRSAFWLPPTPEGSGYSLAPTARLSSPHADDTLPSTGTLQRLIRNHIRKHRLRHIFQTWIRIEASSFLKTQGVRLVYKKRRRPASDKGHDRFRSTGP